MTGEGRVDIAGVRGNPPALCDAGRALADDLECMQLLRDLGERLVAEGDLQVMYQEVLRAAMRLANADAGTLQILDDSTRELVLLATYGFGRTMTDHFARVDAASSTSCGRALCSGLRTVVHFDAPGMDDSSGSSRMHLEAGYRSAQSTPLLNRRGQPIGMLSTHWRQHRVPVEHELRYLDLLARQAADLIERWRAEDRLRESEERFRLLVSSVSQAVWETDGEGRVVTDSPSWRAYTGQSLSSWLEDGWIDAVHPDDRERALRQWRDAVKARRNLDAEFRLRHADGSWHWTNAKATPSLGPDGQVRKWIGMNIDVTARRDAEEALRVADRRKDEFLATLAHELRNPLAPLRHGVQIARRTGHADPKLQLTLDMMDRQLRHLVRLVDDLLDVGRVHSGKLELRKQPVNLADVLASSIESARAMVEGQDHHFHLRLGQSSLQVLADFDRLVQVFMNLLSNAAKYSESGSDIWLELAEEGGDAVVRVIDTGIGIPESELTHVFDLFSQVRSHQGRADGGLGIGLAIVRSLVHLHGGEVTAHSDGPGRGSVFTVRLPMLSLPVAEAASEPTPSSRPAAARRILVVDDNVDAGDSLAALLELLGHQVFVARDGWQAISLAEAEQPDVVFLDIGMPTMDGIEAARRLRKLAFGPNMLIIALTGWGQAADRQRTRDAGFDHHLVKPIDEPMLVEALERKRP